MLPSFLPYLLLYSPTYLLLKVRYNEAADTYSFGLLLWELAHRQTVFAEHTGVQVASPRSTGARDRSPPISNPSKSPPSTGCRGARVHPPSESRYTSRSAGSPFHRHRSAGSFPSKEPNRRSTSPPPAPGRLVQASLQGFAIRGHTTSISESVSVQVATKIAPSGQRPSLQLPTGLEGLSPLIRECWHEALSKTTWHSQQANQRLAALRCGTGFGMLALQRLPFSSRSCLWLPQASASRGQSAARAAFMRAGHLGLVLGTGTRTPRSGRRCLLAPSACCSSCARPM